MYFVSEVVLICFCFLRSILIGDFTSLVRFVFYCFVFLFLFLFIYLFIYLFFFCRFSCWSRLVKLFPFKFCFTIIHYFYWLLFLCFGHSRLISSAKCWSVLLSGVNLTWLLAQEWREFFSWLTPSWRYLNWLGVFNGVRL